MRGQRGQASVELMLMLPLLFVVGLCIWQVHLVLSVANDAENAARTAARKGGGVAAAEAALQREYRDDMVRCRPGSDDCTRAAGGHVRVVVKVPVLLPFGDWHFKVHGDADMPQGLF